MSWITSAADKGICQKLWISHKTEKKFKFRKVEMHMRGWHGPVRSACDQSIVTPATKPLYYHWLNVACWHLLPCFFHWRVSLEVADQCPLDTETNYPGPALPLLLPHQSTEKMHVYSVFGCL